MPATESTVSSIPATDFPTPSITSIRIVGGIIEVDWSVSDPVTDPGGYLVSLFDGDTVKLNVTSDEMSVGFAPPADLDSATVYSVRVACGSGVEIGTYSEAVPVILAAPTITLANANGTEANIDWTVPDAYSAYTSYAAFVYENGTDEIGQAQGSGTSADVPVPGPLPSSEQYTARVQIVAGQSSGPLSEAFAVTILPAPVITSLSYDGSVISVSWENTDPFTGQDYLASVFEGDVVKQNATGTGLSCPIQPAFTLDANTVYTVKVAFTSGRTVGSYSEPAVIYTSKPDLQNLLYDGQKITAGWSYETGTIYGNGFLMSLFKDGTVIQNETGEGAPGELIPSAAFEQGHTYTIETATAQDTSIGPYSDPLELIFETPSVTSASFDGTSISANFQFPDVSVTGNGFVFSLFADGEKIQDQTGSGSSANITPDLPLQSSVSYTIRVASQKGASTGPYSESVDVIQAVSEITLGTWDGTTISLNWVFPSAAASAMGTLISLFKDGQLIQSSSASGASGTLKPTDPLQGSSSYTISTALTAGVFVGPYNDPLSIITDTISITSVTFDGQVVSARLDFPGAPERSFFMSLLEDDKLIQNASGTGINGSLALATPPTVGKNYTLQTALAEGNSIGAYGESALVIVSSPEITGLNYDGESIGVTVSFPDPSAGVNYTIALFADGVLVKTAAGTGTNGVLTPDERLDTGVDYTLRVASVNGISTGPYSAPQSLPIVVAPVIAEVIYDGTDLTVTWTLPDPTVGEDYLLSIFEGSQVVKSAPPGTGKSAKIDNVSGVFTQDSGYTVKVASTKDNEIGPYSEAVEIIIPKPSVTAVGYNGSEISLNWYLPDLQVTGIGYKVSLFEDGTLQQAVTGFGASVSFVPEQAPVSGKTYTTSVTSVKDISTGPASEPATVAVISAPALTSLGYDGSQIAGNWTYPDSTDGYLLSVFNGDNVYFNETSDVPLKTFAPPASKPLDPSVDYTLKVAASKDGAYGPYSTPAPIIQQAPSISAMAFDGTNLSLNWTIPDESVGDGYLVSIFKGSQVYQNQGGTGDSVAFEVKSFPDAGPYTVKVASASGVAVSPYSVEVTIIQDAPANVMLNFTGTRLVASWSYGGAAGTNFEAYLYEDGVLVETIDGTSLSTEFTKPLSPGSLYTTNVRVKSGNSSGPLSDIATGPFSASRNFTFDSLYRIQVIGTENYNTVTYTIDNPGNIETRTFSTTESTPPPEGSG